MFVDTGFSVGFLKRNKCENSNLRMKNASDENKPKKDCKQKPKNATT